MEKSFLVFIISLLISILNIAYADVYDFTEGNQLTLIQESKESEKIKLELVKKAQHHIHIMTYYWDSTTFPTELIGELKKAHARGVEIRITTTFIPTLATDVFLKSFWSLMNGKNDSKATLSFLLFKPTGTEVFTNNLHEKIFLVDGKKAILGGRNVSDNAQKAKDLEVILEGPVVNQVQNHFLKMFTFVNELTRDFFCDDDDKKCLDNYNSDLFSQNDSSFFPTQKILDNGIQARILTHNAVIDSYKYEMDHDDRLNLKDDIIETITQTNFEKIRYYSYFIIPTPYFQKFLESSLANGKEIEVITNSLSSSAFISNKGYLYSLPQMKKLVKKGLNVHQWKGYNNLSYIHEKVMLFDDNHGIIGSHNFGIGSTTVSNEIAVEFYSTEIVKILSDVFDSEVANKQITKEISLKNIQKEIDDNELTISILNLNFIENILSEIY